MRILLTCIGLACAATMLMISHAEKQQEAALDRLSSYELKPQSVLYDDPDLKQVTARSPYIWSALGPPPPRKAHGHGLFKKLHPDDER